MANNKKITDLPLRTPVEGYNFVVATGNENFRVEYSQIESSIKSSIGPINPGPDPGLLDKINLLSGRLDNAIDDLVATGDHLHEHVDLVSGDLIATGEYLEEHIDEGHEDPPGFVESSFMFFSDFQNNTGPTFKTYYETPTQDTFLSGVMVDSLKNVKAMIKWDGPDSHYMGTGYINNQEIPLSNITELGDRTRRFEGYIDNLDLDGQTSLTGSANGTSGVISLIDLGAGPVASNITIDQISNSIPKAGELQGTTALKAGDQINVFVTCDFSIYLDELQHPNTIEVKDDGIADHIDFTTYNLADNGDGTRTATIPVTISNRIGDLGVHVRAVNNLGSTGEFQSSIDFVGSDDSRLLDQLYPTITASDPAFYNGDPSRIDGLREGESTSFANSVANWDSANDTILYTASTVNNANISITNPNSFEDPKNIDYVDGVFADTANVDISTVRVANGATDSEDIIVKVANGPEITSVAIPNQAKAAVAPNVIGDTEIKGGDTIEIIAEIDTQGENAGSIEIRIFDAGISDGDDFGNYNATHLSGDIYQYIIPVEVTSDVTRNGSQSIIIEARNQYGTLSDPATSSPSNQITVNQTAPVVSISSVSYPSSQEAIKSGESATISNSVTGEDSVLYESPSIGGSSQLDIKNPTTNESSKIADYQAGGYNITTDNFKITATKNSNGAVTVAQETVYIANDPLDLSVTSLASSLESSPAGISDNFNLNSNQLYLSAPSLSTDTSQSPSSQLDTTQSGTGLNSNKYRITVKDVDEKGTFTWEVSATNLADITTTSISTNPNYTLAGFSEREIFASHLSFGQGLASIGTSVSDPNSIDFENVSKGGPESNGGTAFSYQSYADGIQLDNSYDVVNKFTVCDSNGITKSNGDHVFNLDKLNRSANAAAPGAKFIIKEV
jgi:hypothetical protein